MTSMTRAYEGGGGGGGGAFTMRLSLYKKGHTFMLELLPNSCLSGKTKIQRLKNSGARKLQTSCLIRKLLITRKLGGSSKMQLKN
ncbi:hypothetical protein RchiOBHm_Chr4g0389591 [Rosa chinensis]|uniref:Uncharacterized protein n=1 Tax=Rosa chinensis TaxID=74649 RepID=A0A2P6QQ17_ROSCH|nr:hypothetical protein RchiOBHm_Chr4g0389591 [Rosa chinensis]